ncbi:MAG TPA: hypothetical protein VFP40_10840, partial [Terriglobales bacterium]|nr:hypothetical protein [Terriglobales bacterium]
MKKHNAWLVLIIVLLGTMAFPQVKTLVPLPFNVIGELNGVPYQIAVPANWNGTLLVYAHGYAGANPPQLALFAGDVNPLLAKGFALAASKFAGTGWNVKEGMQNTANLTA